MKTKEDSGLITHCRFCMIKCIIIYGNRPYDIPYTKHYHNYNVHADHGNHLDFFIDLYVFFMYKLP